MKTVWGEVVNVDFVLSAYSWGLRVDEDRLNDNSEVLVSVVAACSDEVFDFIEIRVEDVFCF